MNKDGKDNFESLVSSKYYLFIPFAGPIIDPDKIKSDQINTAKTLRGRLIKNFIKVIEYVEKAVQP